MSTMSNTEKAQSYMWYYYLSDQGSRKYYVTNTIGFVDKAWVNLNLEMANKRVGATCRHVVPDHNFPVGSLLLGATIPCIDIHDISWATEPASQNIIDLVQDSSPLSVVGENFLNNFQEGQAALFDPQPLAWDSDKLIRSKTATADYPAALLFSGKKTVLLYRGRGASSSECNVFATGVPSLFGNATPGDTVFQPSGSNRCYMYGTVSFTAGVIKPPKSRYISSQVVEANVIAKGTHPLREEDTVASFEQSIWVSEALSLMSDVMTVIAITNSSSLPTWNNLDNYTGALIRIAYLAAWDMLHGSFEQTDTTTLQALPAAQRLRASVSPERVFGWFAVNLLLTASGIVIIWIRSRRCERGIILDAPAAALLTDAGGVVDMYPDMTRLSIVADEDKKVGNIYLNSVADQDGRPKFRLELHKGVL
ncbi:MAG: hypothetical protein M1813_005854 [Trichoglossum hirsutum]|nr:MAG: hypothetical protein M1813_005854 [Trichoglossum hirsutum]